MIPPQDPSPPSPPAGAPAPHSTPGRSRESATQPVPDAHSAPDDWVPLHDRPWHFRWRKGWRLIVLLATLLTAYAVLRGKADYQSLRQWRAQRLMSQLPAETSPDAQRRLLQQAITLAPEHEPIIRAVADFSEPNGDPSALQAMDQLHRLGHETPEDLTRRVRLALTFDRVDANITEALNAWNETSPDTLETERLVLGARWLARQGQVAPAVNRLSQRIPLEKDPALHAGLLLTKAQLILGARKFLSDPAAPVEAWGLLAQLLGQENTTRRLREDAATALAESFQNPASLAALLTPERLPALINLLGTAMEPADLPSLLRLRLDLSRTALRLRHTPLEKTQELDGLCARWKDASADCRLALFRWLNTGGHFENALTWADRAAPEPETPDWRVSRLDVLFALQKWPDLDALLKETAPKSPLSDFMRHLFAYRSAAAQGKTAEAATQRAALFQETAAALPAETIFAAGNLENIRDWDGALRLFRHVRDQPGMASIARQGIVRCLAPYPDRVPELIHALESLLTQEPGHQEARADLAYLRLLEDQAIPEDASILKALRLSHPHYLSYRTGAALAWLKEKNPAEAFKAYDGADVNWSQAPAPWRIIRAAVLAALDRPAEVAPLLAGIEAASLKPGERLLWRKLTADAPP